MKKGAESSSYVAFVLESSINDRAVLDAVMGDLVASTEANEPGTDIYEWSIFEDGTTLITYERFADSEAALAHHAGFGPYAERFLGAVTVTRFVVFGSPDDALKEALRDAGVSYVSQIGGFQREAEGLMPRFRPVPIGDATDVVGARQVKGVRGGRGRPDRAFRPLPRTPSGIFGPEQEARPMASAT